MSEKDIVQILAAARFKPRSDTLENWEKENPVLLSGEPSVVIDGTESEKIKLGDGVTPWNELDWWKGPKGEKGDTGAQGEPGKDAVIDQAYNPESENAQSGKAVAEAISGIKVSGGGNSETVKEFFEGIVTLDTHTRNYDTKGWKTVGAKGYNTDWGDVKNRDELQVGQTVILPGYNTETQSPVVLLGEVTEIADYAVWMTSITWFPLKNLKGASIIPFDTALRNYSASNWAEYGTYGRQTQWSDISNKNEFRPGDIGILSGKNTTTNASVLCFGEILRFEGSDAITKTIACIQCGAKGDKGADGTVSFDELTDEQKTSLKGEKGDKGDKGDNGREAVYHRYRDQEVKFELKKGHMYSFTVDNDDENSAYIVDKNGKTIAGVAGKTLSGLKNGMIICADRCTGFGLTGELSLMNLTAYVNDRWDWDDDYREQWGPYYLKTTTTDGIDIWEV